jgi:myo-inositol 2-dehydrogenase/D-chiro-inositol 1-dehydrogenase
LCRARFSNPEEFGMSIRVAVIGAGIMGSDHARIVAEDLPGAVLQVMCDAAAERARKVADALGAMHVATDPLAVISRADVDAVLVASPDATHAPLSLACLAAGKPVLCEKPLSQSSAECLQVVEAEARAGRRRIQVGFMRRFDQSYAEMKAALLDGSLGRPLMMHNFHRNVETPGADFTADMAITNSAPHEFDIGRFMLGSDYTSIAAFRPSVPSERVGPVFMVLQTAAGHLVNVEINNNAAYGYDVRGELVGERGSISLSAPVYTSRDAALRHETEYAQDWRPRFAEAYRRQNRAFLHFVRTGVFPSIAADAWDGYCAAATAEAGVRSLSEGRAPILLRAQPDLYAR